MVPLKLRRALKAVDRKRAGKLLRAVVPRPRPVIESRRLRVLERAMTVAESYPQWRQLAAEHDRTSGAERWKQREDGRLCDARQIRARHDRLAAFCAAGDLEQVLFALNEGVHGNMGGMGRATLYQRSLLGTKTLIENYVALICTALRQQPEHLGGALGAAPDLAPAQRAEFPERHHPLGGARLGRGAGPGRRGAAGGQGRQRPGPALPAGTALGHAGVAEPVRCRARQPAVAWRDIRHGS